MLTLAETIQPTINNNYTDSIPAINGADGLLAFIPLAGWLIAFGVREFIKAKIDEIKADAELEREEAKADREEDAKAIEYLREQNRILTSELLILRRTMEFSGPIMEPPSKINR